MKRIFSAVLLIITALTLSCTLVPPSIDEKPKPRVEAQVRFSNPDSQCVAIAIGKINNNQFNNSFDHFFYYPNDTITGFDEVKEDTYDIIFAYYNPQTDVWGNTYIAYQGITFNKERKYTITLRNATGSLNDTIFTIETNY